MLGVTLAWGAQPFPSKSAARLVNVFKGCFPGRGSLNEAGLRTGEPFGNAVLRDVEKIPPEDQEAAEAYYGGVVALQCDYCDKWRFVVPSVHGDRFIERAQTEDFVLFQCFQLKWKDGTGCGVTCEIPSQKYRPPNSNDPGERPLALEARNLY